MIDSNMAPSATLPSSTSTVGVEFQSILAPAGSADLGCVAAEPPPHFHDLHLDQIVAEIAKPWPEHDIAPFFHVALGDPDAIAYRQEVMRDLENGPRMQAVHSFCERMATVQTNLALVKKQSCAPEGERWHLAAVDAYGAAIVGLRQDLEASPPTSRGLQALQAYLSTIEHSTDFRSRAEEADQVRAGLATVRYSMLLQGDTVTVRADASEEDFSTAVKATFAKFRGGRVKDYRAKLPHHVGLNHIEARVLECVALLFRQPFAALSAFCKRHTTFIDPRVLRFNREVHFYIAVLGHLERFRRSGLPLCYPEVTRTSKQIAVHAAWDLALASKLLDQAAHVVCNDFALRDPQRIMVVTGPNNGGKTTFARMVGQVHYLGCLGCPVPGEQARLYHFDRLFTHFERQEDISTLRGKLQDDLVRIRQILDVATPASLIIMNEIFSSTTLQDAIFLGRKVLEQITALDALAVCVTFLAELSSFDAKTVSLVCTVDAADPAIRTFRLEQRPADGRAYALTIARKYRVTRQQLLERIRP